MADEALFLLLHNEMVSGVYKSAEQGEVENGRCITKLENMGFRVGQGLIERFTKDTARFKDELDIMKFICKDFWTTVFKKQIDNLRTNHQGIYVLQDNKFRLLTQMSAGKQYLEHASKVFNGIEDWDFHREEYSANHNRVFGIYMWLNQRWLIELGDKKYCNS
ncbi:trafficking protein particle complex subunit 6B isoform X2 [Suricata suricatta]|uniref:trafficking protein particle complex subunit 6B isoform X2 n=1 Tax=Suricata suricatta TaxID=37032 RepID=UPI001155ACDA|nr:trafficking protein particle complex subunit 6B isoform X2 [Suricata suricatta]XP_029806218.1 trafficking protein particle complex subunit 6B isoform X2 [Suricata suricatta]